MPVEATGAGLALEFLRAIPPFGMLDQGALEQLADDIEVAYYRTGQVVLEAGQAEQLAIVRKGSVQLVDSQDSLLEQRSEGEYIGHRIVFLGSARPYKAIAGEDSLIWHVPAEAYQRLCAQQPSLAEAVAAAPEAQLGQALAAKPEARTIQALIRRAPVTVASGSSIRATATLMSEQRVSSVLVMQEDELLGIVTDKDLRRRVIAAGLSIDQPVDSVMSAPPLSISASDSPETALHLMLRRQFHHLPVLDEGRLCGLISAGDLLRQQAEHPLRLVQDIHRQHSVAGLLALRERLPHLFNRLVAEGRGIEQLGRTMTAVTDAFTTQLLHLAERELGPAPLPWAWLAFGSQAREEQTALTDQDNGLVLAGNPDAEAAKWFEQLATRVCTGLDQLGYRLCPGDIMAMNPKWQLSLAAWQAQFDRWIDSPEPKAVMHCSIFFDMRCIHGDAGLVDQLRDHALGRAAENTIFRRFMAANALGHRPPIGFFRQLVQEPGGSQSEGLDLKLRGIVPIIDLVRLRAMESALGEANTFARLRRAESGGNIHHDDATSLEDALNLIGEVRVEHQARQLQAGEAPGNHVPVQSLSPLMRRNLKAAFAVVAQAQQALAQRYQVH